MYDFIDAHGVNVMGQWIRRLSTGDRAKLKFKVRALSEMEFERARGTKLLQGPIFKSIYKLKIHGEVMLRPMLCRGPIDNDAEYTLLAGAEEVNFKLVPSDAPMVAEMRRREIIDDPHPNRRRQIRVRSGR